MCFHGITYPVRCAGPGSINALRVPVADLYPFCAVPDVPRTRCVCRAKAAFMQGPGRQESAAAATNSFIFNRVVPFQSAERVGDAPSRLLARLRLTEFWPRLNAPPGALQRKPTENRLSFVLIYEGGRTRPRFPAAPASPLPAAANPPDLLRAPPRPQVLPAARVSAGHRRQK